jgi:hypothetical protein
VPAELASASQGHPEGATLDQFDVYGIVLQMSIPAQIHQIIMYIGSDKR